MADLESQPLLPALELGPPVFVPAPQEVTYQRNKPSKNRGNDTISFPDDLPVKVVELDLPSGRKGMPGNGGATGVHRQ